MTLPTEKGFMEPPFRKELLQSTSHESDAQLVTPLLPATYRNRHHMVRLVSSDIRAFLNHELDVHRLEKIHSYLWLTGLPTAPRALHYQRLKKRDIVVTEQLDLHCVWSPSRIFIKPLPRWLFSPQFWHHEICGHPHLYQTALGFLLSHVALIEREADYHLAISLHLIPAEITWSGWLEFVEEIVRMSSQSNAFISRPSLISSLEPHVPINPRFYYGELRLGRLNWIYRLVLWKPRGYMSGCTTYGAFLRDNTNSLITLFAYTTIVLSAMQVGLGTQWLQDDYAFGMASYVFSVFSILAPLSAIVFLILVLGTLFVINLLRTLRIRKKRQLQGAGV
ncbi:hypothetical protein K491DRAFT_718796 [Lophiostoma macrostomum CBS 122681]|uniref:Uncharacterized protein n=1 Tax=Lophiostoma macrostomum CBS 122681 TaxID=1314788 RepID=A0A6A6SYE3_9PLEO|nr:hypothetical protein K491DRAFT_718796 [Lophiostoma macrostomum CBS 122681]